MIILQPKQIEIVVFEVMAVLMNENTHKTLNVNYFNPSYLIVRGQDQMIVQYEPEKVRHHKIACRASPEG